MKNYPDFIFNRKKIWLRDVRKRWTLFRKMFCDNDNSVWTGCVYYPEDVHKWLNQFERMDKIMRDYYKNA